MAEGELQAYISVIRALLTSRKNPPTIAEITRDYLELEGEPINYRKLGFPNLETLLASSGEFNIFKTAMGIKVEAKPSTATNHIRHMIAKQKAPPKKAQRKPKHVDNWNTTAFNSMQRQSYVPRQNYMNQYMGGYHNKPQQPPFQWNAGNQKEYPAYPMYTMSAPTTGQRNSVPAPKPVPTSKPQPQSVTVKPAQTAKPVQKPQPIPILKPSEASQPASNRSNGVKEQRPVESITQTAKSSKPPSIPAPVNPGLRLQTRPLPPLPTTNPYTMQRSALPQPPVENNNNVSHYNQHIKPVSRLASRLLVKPKHTNGSESPPPPPVATNGADEKMVDKLNEFTALDKRTEGMTPLQILEEYCRNKGESEPITTFFKMKKTERLQCRMTIGTAVYSTYPDDYLTEAEALSAVATKAWDTLRETEDQLKYPVCMEDRPKIAFMLRSFLQKSPNGVFLSRVPEMFCDEYKQKLPDNWMSIIHSMDHLFSLENSYQNMIIVSALPLDTEREATTEPESSYNMEALELPWNEEHWNLHITNVKSSVEIWARLIGDDYSEKYDAIITMVELDMLSLPKPAANIKMGGIYLATVSDCWYRVRVQKTDDEKSFCFFLDFGEEEWFPNNKLFPCAKSYLSVPAQAVMLSLFGLEDFAENSNALHILGTQLSGKTLVGSVRTSEDEYKAQDSRFEPKITAVLYDTSSEEDVNLNQECINQICETTKVPKLNTHKANNVHYTHVNDYGDIFCNLQDNGVHYIEKLIYQIVSSKFDADKHQVNKADLEMHDDLFLIKDTQTDKWYRAVIKSAAPDSCKNYEAFCVDFGYTKHIPIECIFRLGALSVALYKYPAQAMKVHAADIPKNDHWISRLKALLTNKPGFAKLTELTLVPIIRILIRNENGLIYCINETLRYERELEISQELIESPSKMAKQLPKLPERKFISLRQNVVPNVGSDTTVFVTNTSHPGNFVVRPNDTDIELQEMMNELQKYGKSPEPVSKDQILVNEAYAIEHNDKNWYRVILLNALGTELFHVFLCDYGDIEAVSLDSLKVLPPKFRTLPKQAIKAKVHGIKPRYGDWTLENCFRFRNLVSGKALFATVKDCKKEDDWPNEYCIDVVLCDTSTDEDIYIHDVLIAEDHALPDY